MPRTMDQIVAQADQMAKVFENHEPESESAKDAATLRRLGSAFEYEGRAQQLLIDAVLAARADGHSWAAIGAMIGTSGEAARQRYKRQLFRPGGKERDERDHRR